jgi:tetratricopeptide (TPR) repeat protein
MRTAREQNNPLVFRLRTIVSIRTTLANAVLTALPMAALAVLVFSAAGCERKSVDDYLHMGDQAMRDSKLAEAETNYQKAIDAAPNDPRTHIALGNLYVFEQKTGPAQTEFMKVLELNSKDAPAHAALGNLYAGQQQFGMAEAQYRAAVVLDPTRPSYRTELAGVLAKEAKSADAEAELRTAIGLDPKNAQAHFALANLLSAQAGREAEAQAEYAQAKILDPRLVPPGAAAAEASPAAAATAVASARRPGAFKVKPIDKKFLVTHDSPVYENPDSRSRVVARVHKAGYVRVTGISGDWLRIKMRSGVVGFIPIKAAM